MNAVISDKTVGEWVKEQPSRSRVFEQFGIDYCCGGKKPLVQACTDKGVDLTTVLGALEQADAAAPGGQVDWAQRTMTELCDHIVERHHDYLRREIPRLDFMLRKVVRAHGERHPEMLQVLQYFEGAAEELVMHMRKEEEILFPLIRQMEKTAAKPQFHCGLGMPIHVMEAEHENAGRALERMRELTAGYTPPQDACNTFRALLSGLAEFEADMHEHVHKENNILFPAAQRYEQTL